MEEVQEQVITQAVAEGFITDDTVVIDATHFEARDQAPPKEEKPKTEPKKRGRKSKEEREKWLAEQTEKEANLTLFEKKMEVQLDAPLDDALKFLKNRNGALKRTAKAKMYFGLAIRAIWLSAQPANIFYKRYSLRAA